MTRWLIRFPALELLLAAVTVAAPASAANAQATITLHHVHGLAYSADGKKLMVPSHHGLAVYSAGKWSVAPGPKHDYMGFAATRQYFYSSGHPAEGTGLKDPFGLIRSKDGGRTWEKLGLEGESDFHLLATGWHSNAVYVWNPEPNSRMRRTGLHYTLNDGIAWNHARASGFNDKPNSLAVHPSDPKIVVIAANSGFYISTDSGDTFRVISKGAQALTAYFDLDGEHVWLSSYAGAPALARANLATGAKNEVTLPPLRRDAVAYLAQNPVSRSELAIATFERSVYLSKNGGKSWTQIADRGKGL